MYESLRARGSFDVSLSSSSMAMSTSLPLWRYSFNRHEGCCIHCITFVQNPYANITCTHTQRGLRPQSS